MKRLRYFLPLLLLCVVGCGSTRVDPEHPLLTTASSADAAHVYFIRPSSGYQRGITGNALSIHLDDERVLTLAKGEYTLVSIRPFAGELTVKSDTTVHRGGQNVCEKVTTSRPVELSPGFHYFVLVPHLGDMWEGTSFRAMEASATEAAEAASMLTPIGAAIDSPLASPR